MFASSETLPKEWVLDSDSGVLGVLSVFMRVFVDLRRFGDLEGVNTMGNG